MRGNIGDPANPHRIFIAGASGTGKSSLAYTRYLFSGQRVIAFDMVGEWERRGPGGFPGPTVRTETPAELTQAVRDLGSTRYQWWITHSLDPADMDVIVDWMIPVPRTREFSPLVPLQGVTVLLDEADMISAQATAAEHIRTLYRRSRHVGLSIVSTTQRPENVGREVTAQSTEIVAMRLVEPRGHQYLKQVCQWGPLEHGRYLAHVQSHRHGFVVYGVAAGLLSFHDSNGGPVAVPAPLDPNLSLFGQ